MTFVALITLPLALGLTPGSEALVGQQHILQLAVTAPAPPPGDTTTREYIRRHAPQVPMLSLDDAMVVAIFDNANTADIETGRLAAKRGHSNEVRQFGAMLARDHEMVRQQGRDLTKKLSITPTPPAGDQSAQEQTTMLKRLSGLPGPEFDRAFLEHEVTFHRLVIEAIETRLLPAIESQELRDFVVKVGPAFQAHLAMAEDLLTRVARK
jgi:putative membrane protein